MASWTFGIDLEGWTSAGGGPVMVWEDGHVRTPDGGGDTRLQITTLSQVVSAGDNVQAYVRVVGEPNEEGENSCFVFQITTSPAIVSPENVGTATWDGRNAYDSGWMLVSTTIASGGTVETFEVRGANGGACWPNTVSKLYIDSAYLAEAPPGISYSTPLRMLGMDADGGNLYTTAIAGGTMTLFVVDQSSLIFTDQDTFGTCAYTDPDTFTRGIYPVIQPKADNVLYLHGRDASNVQVQYNDRNGTLGWVNVGPGTATWGTAKYAVALMPSKFAPNSVVVAFADDDIYHTYKGTAQWAKMGDAGTALRAAGRVTTEFSRILVAGQGTATLYYSQNIGVSFTSINPSAGTINAIEVSR